MNFIRYFHAHNSHKFQHHEPLWPSYIEGLIIHYGNAITFVQTILLEWTCKMIDTSIHILWRWWGLLWRHLTLGITISHLGFDLKARRFKLEPSINCCVHFGEWSGNFMWCFWFLVQKQDFVPFTSIKKGFSSQPPTLVWEDFFDISIPLRITGSNAFNMSWWSRSHATHTVRWIFNATK